MLKFFADDSGSNTNSKGVFVLYGYLMEEPRWEDFAERWDAQLKRPDFFPIDYFRMADAHAGDGAFAGVDAIFRKRKVKDLAEVIRDCNPVPIGCKLSWESYHKIVKGNVHPTLDNPYAILFFQVLRNVTEIQRNIVENLPVEIKEQILREHQTEISIKPVDFIFDDQGPAGMKCLQWFGELRSRFQEPHRTVLSNTPQFKDDRDVVPLQAADMLAWHIRRDYEFPGEDRREIFALISQDDVWEREITDEMLHALVDAFNNRVDLSKL